jgi:hypothetical protein
MNYVGSTAISAVDCEFPSKRHAVDLVTNDVAEEKLTITVEVSSLTGNSTSEKVVMVGIMSGSRRLPLACVSTQEGCHCPSCRTP